MGTEAKAKFVASDCDWGAIFVQFFAALAVLPQSIWKKWLNSSYSSKKTKAKQLAQQEIEQIPPPNQTRRPLPWLLSPTFFYALSQPLPGNQTICGGDSNMPRTPNPSLRSDCANTRFTALLFWLLSISANALWREKQRECPPLDRSSVY